MFNCSMFSFVNVFTTVTNGEATVTNGDKKRNDRDTNSLAVSLLSKYELHEFNTNSNFSYSYFTNVVVPLFYKAFFEKYEYTNKKSQVLLYLYTKLNSFYK